MKYEKKITLGRDKDGKLIRKSIYGKSQREIERRAFQAKQEWLLNNPARPDNDIAFMTFARKWLATSKQHASINTRAMYDNVIEKHLAPELNDLYFSEIVQSDLQTIINTNFDKYETCNKIKLTLRQIYSAAVDNDIEIHRTVNIKKLILPKKEKNEKRALTAEETQALTKAELNDKQRAFLYILYYCGLRREEALALEVKHIDLKGKHIKVSQALVFDKNTPVIERTKNSYSCRLVPIPSVFVPFLRDYTRDKQGLLFTMANGEPLTHSSFVKFWQGIQKALSVYAPTAESLTPHLFRHNYATLLYYSDVSRKKAAEIMGHADTTMIDKVYAHLDELKENTNEKIDKVFK